jgi:hypothetical protein
MIPPDCQDFCGPGHSQSLSIISVQGIASMGWGAYGRWVSQALHSQDQKDGEINSVLLFPDTQTWLSRGPRFVTLWVFLGWSAGV